jgi:hypothetical protein
VTTVSQLAARLGPSLLVSARGSTAASISQVLVSDPAAPGAMMPDALVLAVGFPLDQARALQEQAAHAAAAAIVLKGESEPDVSDTGPAVIVIDQAADWGHVISLARIAIGTSADLTAPDDGSLYSLADALSSLCGGPVVIHDSGWQLLAHSSGDVSDPVRSQTLSQRRAPYEVLEHLREAGVVDRLMHGELIHLADEEVAGLSERYAGAVLIGGQLFGTIWVTPTPSTDVSEAMEGLRRAIDVAALALVRSATLGAATVPDHDAPFASLLTGAHTERLVAQRLGVRTDHGFVLTGIRPHPSDPVERASTARRLQRLARSYCEAYRVDALSAAVGDTTFLLLTCADASARESALRVLADLHTRMQRSAPHRAVVGSRIAEIGQLTGERTLVTEVLDLSERRGWLGLIDVEDVQATWRLERFREIAMAHPALVEGPLKKLMEHDRAKGGDLLPTLRAYFEHVGDVKAAAASLGLHYNTVRYRLTKAQQVAELDLEDADQRLLAELQVRLLS